jgi:transcriptional regulator with XRE-family HTH domain
VKLVTKSVHNKKYAHFLDLLIDARTRAGLSQAEVGVRLSRPQSYVSKYENGERRLDVVEFLEIAQVLSFDPVKVIQRLKSV